MEKCSKCDRHASLPFYLAADGKVQVLCFACLCNSAGQPSMKTDHKISRKHASRRLARA
jgi:hypothetical protein